MYNHNLTPNAKGRLAYEELRLREIRQEIEMRRLGDELDASRMCQIRVALGSGFAVVMRTLSVLGERVSNRASAQIGDLSLQLVKKVFASSED